ncbi:MAG: methyltransferase domain-containing protein [Chitinophagaceae bacterium]
MQLDDAILFLQNEYLQSLQYPSVWADFGCGSGLFTQAISYYLKPGSTLYAVDKIRHSKPEIKDPSIQICSLQGDFEKEKIPIENLDGILMANSLHYVKDKKTFLLNCKNYYHNDAFIIIEYNANKSIHHWVPYPLSFSSLKDLFLTAGFKHIHKTGERPSAFGNRNMYAALVLR